MVAGEDIRLNPSRERIGVCPFDLNLDNFPQQAIGRLNMDRLHMWAAPDQLARKFSLPLKQKRYYMAYAALIERQLLGIQ